MDEKNQPPFAASNAATEGMAVEKSLHGIIILESICFFVWLAGIFFYYLPLPKSSITLSRAVGEANIYDAFSILVSVAATLAVFYWLRRKHALAPMVSFLFGVVIYNTLAIFIEPLVAFAVSVLIVFIERMYRSFVTNNFLVILGVFAAGISFAGSYAVNFLLILLGLFALYDLAGVFWVKAIPKVAKNAAKIGMPLLLFVPKKKISWFRPPTPDTIASMLGAGDLFIPLLFLSAVSVQVGYQVALVSLLGAVIGNIGNIFLARKIKGGIPAVPLLAIGLVVGYGAGVWIF